MPIIAKTLILAAAALSNPFDPKGYIDHHEQVKAKASEHLVSETILRLNGQRFLGVTSAEGTVYLPCPGAVPELHEEFAICPQHLRLLGEVLPVRKDIPVQSEIKEHEQFFVTLIRRCNEGRVRGPETVEKTPDGAVVEKKAKDHDSEAANRAADHR